VIEILDAATLEQLTILENGPIPGQWLIFSPDSHLLTWLSHSRKEFINWDLRAGVQLSANSPDLLWISSLEDHLTEDHLMGEFGYLFMEGSSLTYSECGTMLGALCQECRRFHHPHLQCPLRHTHTFPSSQTCLWWKNLDSW
jgi:hypothetical protein